VSDVPNDYVEGDVNRLDDGDEVGDENLVRARTSTATLEYIARSLADDPDAVSVDVSERHDKVILSLRVGPGDMGRVIGRRGRTAQAIRALVGAAGAREGVTTSVDIVD